MALEFHSRLRIALKAHPFDDYECETYADLNNTPYLYSGKERLVKIDTDGNKEVIYRYFLFPTPRWVKQTNGGTINISATAISLPAGSQPTIINLGTSEQPNLQFGLPIGNTGRPSTISINNVITGDEAAVENVGTPFDAILNITLPRGEQGESIQGDVGPQGPPFKIHEVGSLADREYYNDAAPGFNYLVIDDPEELYYTTREEMGGWSQRIPFGGKRGEAGKTPWIAYAANNYGFLATYTDDPTLGYISFVSAIDRPPIEAHTIWRRVVGRNGIDGQDGVGGTGGGGGETCTDYDFPEDDSFYTYTGGAKVITLPRVPSHEASTLDVTVDGIETLRFRVDRTVNGNEVTIPSLQIGDKVLVEYKFCIDGDGNQTGTDAGGRHRIADDNGIKPDRPNLLITGNQVQVADEPNTTHLHIKDPIVDVTPSFSFGSLLKAVRFTGTIQELATRLLSGDNSIFDLEISFGDIVGEVRESQKLVDYIALHGGGQGNVNLVKNKFENNDTGIYQLVPAPIVGGLFEVTMKCSDGNEITDPSSTLVESTFTITEVIPEGVTYDLIVRYLIPSTDKDNTGGHIIVDEAGVEYPQRSKLQINDVIITDLENADTTLVQLKKIIDSGTLVEGRITPLPIMQWTGSNTFTMPEDFIDIYTVQIYSRSKDINKLVAMPPLLPEQYTWEGRNITLLNNTLTTDNWILFDCRTSSALESNTINLDDYATELYVDEAISQIQLGSKHVLLNRDEVLADTPNIKFVGFDISIEGNNTIIEASGTTDIIEDGNIEATSSQSVYNALLGKQDRVTNGDGTKYLSDDGTYKTVIGGGGGTPAVDVVQDGNSSPITSNAVYDSLQNKVDKVEGKSLIDDTEITRLAGITNYTHPTTHPATMITEDTTHRFSTDTEKAKWSTGGGYISFAPARSYDTEHIDAETLIYVKFGAALTTLQVQINGGIITTLTPTGTYPNKIWTGSIAIPANAVVKWIPTSSTSEVIFTYKTIL